MQSLSEKFKHARSRGVPLLGIETPDPQATIDTCVQAISNGTTPPVFIWDAVGGMRWGNPAGEAAAMRIFRNAPDARQQMAEASINPVEALLFAAKLDAGSCVFFIHAQTYIDQPACATAIWLLRDCFKASKRTLVLLGPTLHLPAELANDVMLFDEPLPDDIAIGNIADALYSLTGNTTKFPRIMRENTIRAARGLSAFSAEQAIALSLNKQGVDTDALWSSKRKMIEATKGLRVYAGSETFSDIGGLHHIKEFSKLLFHGNSPPSCVVWIDELEKAMAGSSGPVADSSGTSQDQLGQILCSMQNNSWAGMILPGPPGTAKSLFAKALGATHGIPCIQLDLGAMKGSLVGQSEQQIRQALKVILAVAGKNAYFIATCNRMENLPPELRRRFTDSVWFFALPSVDERQQIWKIMLKQFKIDTNQDFPNDDRWTGADIRNACSLAYRLKCSLIKATEFITPVAQVDPQSIERLYKAADNRWLSASHPGLFKMSIDEQPHEGRRVNV